MAGGRETGSDKIFSELRKKREEGKTPKKRRYSRIIMIFDALVIIIILIVIQNRTTDRDYLSTLVNVKGLETRFSITEIKETKSYAFTLTLKGTSEKPVKAATEGDLAFLDIRDSGEKVYSGTLGEGTKSITIHRDEIRTFILSVRMEELDRYLAEKKKLKRKRRSIIDLTSQTYRFRAEMKINFKEPVVIPIDFTHEVNI